MSRENISFLLFIFVLNIVSLKVCAYRVFDTDSGLIILALENETVNIQCRSNMPMTYCGFIHPSGRRYSFSGEGLKNGKCAIKTKLTQFDSGEWNCHIGKESTGVEIMQSIQVRVVKQLAAIRPNVTAVHGKSVTLKCATAKQMMPISYCRFEPPNGRTPFSINSDITLEKPILGKYYYPQNYSIDRGDCSVTIKKVKYEDVGLWTCGAGLDDGKEHIDVISLEVEGLYTMSTASATGITFGAIGIAAFLCVLGILAWKKRRFLGAPHPEPEIIEIQELGLRPVTPRSARGVPCVTIQSPSEQSASSGMVHPIA